MAHSSHQRGLGSIPARCHVWVYNLVFIGATSSTREELNQFKTAVSSFHLALKYIWEISDTSVAFLDIKVSIEG